MDNEPTASAQELEREIQRTQLDLERVIEAIETRLEPRNLFYDAFETLWRGRAGRETVGRLGGTIARNPVPATLLAVAGAWMAADAFRSRRTSSAGNLPPASSETTAYGAPPGEGVIVGAPPAEPSTATIYEADRSGNVYAKHDVDVAPTTPASQQPSPAPETVVGAQPSHKSASASAEAFRSSTEAERSMATNEPGSPTVLVRPDGTPLSEKEVDDKVGGPQKSGGTSPEREKGV